MPIILSGSTGIVTPSAKVEDLVTGKIVTTGDSGELQNSFGTISPPFNITATSGFANLEMGGPSGAYIDMKSPADSDYDARIIYQPGNSLSITTNSTSSDPILLRQGNSTKLSTSSTGITVTGGLGVNSGNENVVATFTSSDTEAQINLVDTTGSAQIRSRNDLRFYTNGGSTRAMDIDSSGNVGINVTSPSTPLHVDCGAPSSSDKTIATFQSQAARQIGFVWDDNESTMGIATLTNHSMTFHTNGNSNERMRIDGNGDLLIGKTSATDSTVGTWIDADGRFFQTSNNNYTAQFRRNGSDGVVVYFLNDGSIAGNISISGSTAAYNTSSDYRLKTDVQPMTGASARVQALNPVNFEWISDGTRVDGFLAHEAATVVPEAITGEKDAMRDEEYEVTPAVEATFDEEGNVLTEAVEAVMGTRNVPDYQGIDQSKIVPLLTAALQEALTKIDSLETRLTALEG